MLVLRDLIHVLVACFLFFCYVVAVSGIYLLHFIRKNKVIAHSRKHSSYISVQLFIMNGIAFHHMLSNILGLVFKLDYLMQWNAVQPKLLLPPALSLTVQCEDAYGKTVSTFWCHVSSILYLPRGHTDASLLTSSAH